MTPEEESKQILNWEATMVQSAGGRMDHPKNRKIVLWVHLKDLQKETGLSDDALYYIRDVCDAAGRCDPRHPLRFPRWTRCPAPPWRFPRWTRCPAPPTRDP